MILFQKWHVALYMKKVCSFSILEECCLLASRKMGNKINVITLMSGIIYFLQHRGIPYCNIPCYSLLFGPGGYGRGGTESYQYFDEKLTPAELDALRYDILKNCK